MTAELGSGRSSGLDALRAAACLAVVLFHMHSRAHVGFGPLDPLVSGGDMGVWVFFAISGYLLYRPFLRHAVDLRSYALKRAARILPGYYVALVSLFLLTGSQLPLDHPVAYVSISSSYEVPLREFLGPAWTLSAEVLFYITLPLIARFAAGREVRVLLALGTISIVLSLLQRYTATEATTLNDAYPLVFYGFVPGMLLAVLEVRRPATFAALAETRYLLIGLVYIALGLLISILPIHPGILLGAPLVMGWFLQHRIPGRRALVFAGGASYALYLWHYDLLRAFGVGGVVVALVGAALSWSLVERPILDWAHRRASAWRLPSLPNSTLHTETGTAGADT